AVYLAGKNFGLRSAADNFSDEELAEAVKHTHSLGKKIYVAVNVIPKNSDLEGIEQHMGLLNLIQPDAVIVSDPGVLDAAIKHAPSVDIHLSTQSNCTNYQAARFWYKRGVKRINLARELRLDEITEIIDKSPGDLEFETFVHGAMCMAYSGRCLLSAYMAGREANTGDCAQSCRWKYSLLEEQRPGEYFPVEEDGRGTYILSSADLCLVEHIDKLARAGVNCFKIEGRVKSAYYAAVATSVYRQAIDSCFKSGAAYAPPKEWLGELEKISHRRYFPGFLFGNPGARGQLGAVSKYESSYDFLAIVRSYDATSSTAVISQKNKFSVGENIEIIRHNGENFRQNIKNIKDMEGNEVEAAPRAGELVMVEFENPVEEWDIIRRKRGEVL
ncbi:MAG: U32 family peptidase, partial [Elusimicrobia bacterium]|nr:U32 family peptidase [Elusimicrobiota bacterium]